MCITTCEIKTIVIILLVGISGCSPAIRSYYDYDKQDNIGQYRSFSWQVENQNPEKGNPLYYSELNDKRIKSAVNDLLRVKGYILADKDAELMLHYHIVMEERSMLAPDPYGYMYGDYFMRPRADVFNYKEGTLILDFMNAKNNNLVWRGWVVAAMEVVLYDTKDTDALIRSAVTKILQNLPERVADTDSSVTVR